MIEEINKYYLENKYEIVVFILNYKQSDYCLFLLKKKKYIKI